MVQYINDFQFRINRLSCLSYHARCSWPSTGLCLRLHCLLHEYFLLYISDLAVHIQEDAALSTVHHMCILGCHCIPSYLASIILLDEELPLYLVHIEKTKSMGRDIAMLKGDLQTISRPINFALSLVVDVAYIRLMALVKYKPLPLQQTKQNLSFIIAYAVSKYFTMKSMQGRQTYSSGM